MSHKTPKDSNGQSENKRRKNYFSKEKRKEASKKGREGGREDFRDGTLTV